MTAAAAAVAAQIEQIQNIEIDRLFPSEFNPRKFADVAKIADLVASIKQHGVQVPLTVRPMAETNGVFEVIAGGRRLQAGTIADLSTLPCVVREMTDEEAREIALIDNLQREDMPALEEAEAYESLRQQLGNVESIAARVGKPVEYVAKRLRLVALGAFTRQALAERLITIDHALLLARLGTEDEEAALKWCLDHTAGSTVKLEKVIADCIERRDRESSPNRMIGYHEPQTVLRLKAHIEQTSGRRLSRAPWDLEDATLVPHVAACIGCPQNTAANAPLFGDLAIEEATCADGICFESKRAAFVQRILSATPPPAALLSWKASSVRPKWLKDGSGPDLGKTLREGQWVEAKPNSCEHVIQGVTVDWLDLSWSVKKERLPGETLAVCVAEGCKKHPKAYETKESAKAGDRHDDAAEKARRLKNQELHLAENKRRLAFVGAMLEGVRSISSNAIRMLAAAALPHWDDGQKPYNALLPGIVTLVQTAKTDSADFARAVTLAAIHRNIFQVNPGDYSDHSKDGRDELIKIVRGLGYHGATPWDELEAAKPKAAAKKAAAKKTAAKKAPAKKAAVKKAAAKKTAAEKVTAKKTAKKAAKT